MTLLLLGLHSKGYRLSVVETRVGSKLTALCVCCLNHEYSLEYRIPYMQRLPCSPPSKLRSLLWVSGGHVVP